MKKILKKRNGKLTSVYQWAVEYSLQKARERKLTSLEKDVARFTEALKTRPLKNSSNV